MRMYAPSQATLPHAYRVVRIQLIRVRNEGVNVNVNVNVNSLLVLCTGVYTIWYLVTGCVLADHLPGRRGNQDGPPATGTRSSVGAITGVQCKLHFVQMQKAAAVSMLGQAP